MNSVTIEPKSVIFPPTYISSKSIFTIKIVNSNSDKLKFQWRRFPTEEAERKAIDSLDLSDPEQRCKIHDTIYFQSDTFTFEPSEGFLWPKNFNQIILSFVPQISLQHNETAYLYIEETKQRIPLNIIGTGLAPEAVFSISSVNIGHVALDTIMEYQIFFENIGQVGVDFKLVPKDTGNVIFEFFPSSGHAEIGEKLPINVKFIANEVGAFSETFTFNIRGKSNNHPKVSFFGSVIGPSYYVSKKIIDFGEVSFGFIYGETFEIVNKSNIPFDYELSLSYDGSYSRREFSVSPQTGTIDKFGKQLVKIEFIPVSSNIYKLSLYLNIARCGEHLVTIPISATCICPPVIVVEPVLNLGNLFIGYKYSGFVTLKNLSNLPAKFEYLPTRDASILQGKIEIEKPNGVIQPMSEVELEYSIVPSQLGPLSIDRQIKVIGSRKQPLQFTIKALCTGPNIVFSCEKIVFGSISVLKDHSQTLRVLNDSKIPAEFNTQLNQKYPVFRIQPESGLIAPEAEILINVIANINDSIEFDGQLIFSFKHLNPILFNISATGYGATLVSSIPMNVINLGYIFTQFHVFRNFTIENKGLRSQEVRWISTRPKVQGGDISHLEYKITPDSYVLKPGDIVQFTISFYCSNNLSFSMTFQCNTTLGKKRFDLFSPLIEGTFIKPILRFSKQQITFLHIHDSVEEERLTGEQKSIEPITPAKNLLKPIKNSFLIQNVAMLAMDLFVDCPEPFFTDESQFILEPNASKTISVTFDPSMKEDYSSEIIQKKMEFSIDGVPNKFNVNLKAEMVFPNIQFTPSDEIDFGILLKRTEQVKEIKMMNTTELPVQFVWEVFNEDGQSSNVFDIYPIRGFLAPKTEDVSHVSFFAQSIDDSATSSYKATAICHVHGGPDYVFKLSGGSADIRYKLDQSRIDFGDRAYLETLKDKIILSNISEVQMSYTVKIPKHQSFNSFTVTPEGGIIDPGGSSVLNINIVPGMPKEYSESFFIQIGHFDETKLDINVRCYIPQLQISLPRAEDDPVLLAYKSDSRVKASKRASLGEVRDMSVDSEMDDINEERLLQIETLLMVTKLSVKQNLSGTQIKKRQKKDDPPVVFDGYIGSRFFLDFGSIVFGKEESHKITLRNRAPFPISFEILDGNLQNTGFYIEPTLFSDIPSDQVIEITVNFDTKLRTSDITGYVTLEVPIKFSNDYGYMITIVADLSMPVLNFSQQHLDFGTVIVGQAYILTLQLQNMSNAYCEYRFYDAQYINVLQRSMASGKTPVFSALPSSGILPPASFQNINITFLPTQEKSYSMQFPIEIKHNDQMSYVTLKGVGIQLKVVFEPSELVLPPILPFNGPSFAEVTMVNPTEYPIEVMAKQFDFQLMIEEMNNVLPSSIINCDDISYLSETWGDHSLIASARSSFVSKFSLCVIVYGAPGSGQTTVSNDISKYLGIKVISLKEIWAGIIESTDATQADYVQAFSHIISQPEYAEGFVVDGLDVIPEHPDTEQFLTQCIKQKNIWDQLSQNPLHNLQHSHLTAPEQALAYVIASLDGHYVFFVTLRATDFCLRERAEAVVQSEKKKKRLVQKQEREWLNNMTEDQYFALTDKEREEVDKKRESIRRKVIKAIEEKMLEENNGNGLMSRKSSNSKKNKRRGDSKKDDRKKSSIKDKRDPMREKKEDSQATSRSKTKYSKFEDPKMAFQAKYDDFKRKLRSTKTLPSDSVLYGIIKYSFIVGSLAEMLLDGKELFTAIDPLDFKNISSNGSASEELINVSHNSALSAINVKKNDMSTSLFSFISDDYCFKMKNTIVIDTYGEPDEVSSRATNFLPLISQLKENAFTRLIPAPESVIPDPSFLKRHQYLTAMPKHFFIHVDDSVTSALLSNLNNPTQSHEKHNGRPDTTPSGGRKSRSAKKGKDEIAIPKGVDITKCTPRWRIEPYSSEKITIRFEADLVGEYNDDLIFCLLNGTCEITKLKVSGLCSYPNIERDTKVIFPKRIPKYVEDKADMTFINETNTFNFGSVLVTKEKQQKGAPPPCHQVFKLQNISPFPTNISVILSDLHAKGIWVVEHPNFTIRPNEIYDLLLGINPAVPDSYSTTAYIHIKDNPDPFIFNLSADVCVPILEVPDAGIDFDKILLDHTKTLDFNIKNTGKVPAFWKLKGLNQLGPNFVFEQTEGLLNVKQECVLRCHYSSSKPLIVRKAVQFEIYDKDATRCFSSKQIQVSAESFDVSFDLQYPKGFDHLQFGSLKVSQPRTITILLRNKGKYPSMFNFVFTSKKFKSLFRVVPEEGTLNPGDKPSQVNITFSTSKLVTFQNAKAIVLKVIDSLSNAVSDSINIPFSAKTHFSSFSITSATNVQFGPLTVGQIQTKTITIQNNGAFSFEFDIQPKKEATEVFTKNRKLSGRSVNATPNSNNQTKNSPLVKRPKRGNEKSIQVGNFFITPSSSVVQPNQIVTINIDAGSNSPGDFYKTALISISDVDPAEQPKANEIKLSMQVYEPGIISQSFDKIFFQTESCLRYDLRKTGHTAFLEDEQLLHFAPIILGSKSEVPFRLINPLPIPCQVDLSFSTKNKAKETHDNNPFNLNEKSVYIEANSTKEVLISFEPTLAGNYTGNVEVIVKGGTNLETKGFAFSLEGIGILPSLTVLSQTDKSSKQGAYSISLGKTLIGLSKNKTIAISNDGLIPANIQIFAKPTPDFELLDIETNEFVLDPGHIFNLPIHYKPQKARKAQFDIQVIVTENPKSNISFSIIGEGFLEDIVFEGLQDDENDLHFKDNVVGTQQQLSFTMRNVSQNDIKFSWNCHTDFVFSPKLGHLRVNQSKTVTVTFSSDKPVKHNSQKFCCVWQRIELSDPSSPDWDDTMKAIKFTTKSALNQQQTFIEQQLPSPESKKRGTDKNGSNRSSSKSKLVQPLEPASTLNLDSNDSQIIKVTEIKPEPEHTVIPGKCKDLFIRVFAISDYIKYHLDMTEVAFSPTMMFQSRIVEVNMHNTSQVRFEYSWSHKDFVALRQGNGPNIHFPFSIEPRTGYIDSGSTTKFRVIFSPEEVDDFNAVLHCDVPYLTNSKPPQILVSGFSRRPLCHFDIQMSDYISAGRRHPEYKYKIPDDIKVIEIFSPSVNTRVNKKFELINPTSTPYEVTWTRVKIEGEQKDKAIVCDTPNVLVSSGKRYPVSFSYIPQSAKTIESRWEFQIPEHNVSVQFLIVGRVIHV